MTIIFDKSLFAKYFSSDDPAVLAWAENVLDKLIEKGLVANFILREDEAGNETDFEELYRPVCIFFGYLVQLARQFESFTNDQFLSDQYLNNHGHFTCGDESLDELVYAIENSLRVRAQRGTIKMIEPSTDSGPDGEILRLVCWDQITFFKLGVARPEYNSWNADHSGPSFRGCTGRYDLNIGYEYTEDIEDLSLYPLVNSGSVFLTTYKGRGCMEAELVFGDEVGIGNESSNKKILVDPRFNFEITFYIAQDINLSNITFKCLAFDVNGDPVNLQSVDGINTNSFFETRRLNKSGQFYFVRGILFNKDKQLVSADEAKLNIGFGHNLKMSESVASIIPRIVIDDNVSNDSDAGDSNSESIKLLGPPSSWSDISSPIFTKSDTEFSFNGNPGAISFVDFINLAGSGTSWSIVGPSPSVTLVLFLNSKYLYGAFPVIAGQTYSFNLNYTSSTSNVDFKVGFFDSLFNDVGGSQDVNISSGTHNVGISITPTTNGSYMYFFADSGLFVSMTLTLNLLTHASSDLRAYQNLSLLAGDKIEFDLKYNVVTLGGAMTINARLTDESDNELTVQSIIIGGTGAGSQAISLTAPTNTARIQLHAVLATASYNFSIILDNEFMNDGSSYDGQPSIFLWNVKVTPCALKYERCYLNNKNFIDLIIDNKNGKYSNVQVETILRKYFIPYNTAFNVTHLNDLGDIVQETSLLLLESGDYILLEDENKIELE